MFLMQAQETALCLTLSFYPKAGTMTQGLWDTSHLTGRSHFTIPYTSTLAAGTQQAREHFLVRALYVQQETKSYKTNVS